MTREVVRRWHRRLMWVWGGPVTLFALFCAFQGWLMVVLVINLLMSTYTICTQHFLGQRQEKDGPS